MTGRPQAGRWRWGRCRHMERRQRRTGGVAEGGEGGRGISEGSSLRPQAAALTSEGDALRRVHSYDRPRHGADVVREAVELKHTLAQHDLLEEADGEAGHRGAAPTSYGRP